MTDATPPRRSSLPVWLLLLVVTATAIYFVKRDMDDRAKANRGAWDRLAEDLKRARAEEETTRLLGR